MQEQFIDPAAHGHEPTIPAHTLQVSCVILIVRLIFAAENYLGFRLEADDTGDGKECQWVFGRRRGGRRPRSLLVEEAFGVGCWNAVLVQYAGLGGEGLLMVHYHLVAAAITEHNV